MDADDYVFHEGDGIKMSLIVYSKEGCTYCDMAKSLLNANNIPYREFPMNDESRNSILYVFEKYNWKSFPLILDVDWNMIGGFNELSDWVAETQEL